MAQRKSPPPLVQSAALWLALRESGGNSRQVTLKETKCYSENVAQLFSHLIPPTDVQIREGYLSIDDPLEEVYRYPEGYQIIQELAVEPLQLDHADLADRMIQGGALSFSSIWNHINKYLPDEAYTLINERLSRIKKTQ